MEMNLQKESPAVKHWSIFSQNLMARLTSGSPITLGLDPDYSSLSIRGRQELIKSLKAPKLNSSSESTACSVNFKSCVTQASLDLQIGSRFVFTVLSSLPVLSRHALTYSIYKMKASKSSAASTAEDDYAVSASITRIRSVPASFI